MEYQDEKIISARMEARRQNEYTIDHEVMIEGIPYTFKRMEVIQSKMSMVLPQSFNEMLLSAIRVKYPSEYRPKIVICNDNGSVNFAFNNTDISVEREEELYDRIQEMRTALKRMNPAFLFYSQKEIHLDNIRVETFDFKSYALDMDLYNLIFISKIEGNLLVGTFNCPDTSKKSWQPLVIQMLHTIKDLTID